MARPILKTLMIVGLLTMIAGPVARISNEGFGDPPGPIQFSDFWQRMSYILIPAGASLTVICGLILVILDARRRGNDVPRDDPKT